MKIEKEQRMEESASMIPKAEKTNLEHALEANKETKRIFIRDERW